MRARVPVQELEERISMMGQTVREQLTDALAALSAHDPTGAEHVIERDDVIDGQRSALEERCYELQSDARTVLEARRLRSALKVIANLERIGDAGSHIAKHCIMLVHEGDEALPLDVDELAEIALAAVDEGVRAFVQDDLELAQISCEREPQLDALYVQRIQEVARLIDGGKIGGDTALHLLAVLKYLEKVCDFVLNIGETAVYSLTGSRLSYPQFKELRSLLPGDDVTKASAYKHFWDGISGATVLEVGRPEGQRLVFKEGASEKVQDEYYKTIEWESIAPEHTARVIGITKANGRNGILREFAEGSLLRDLLLSDVSVETKEETMQMVTNVLNEIWRSTINPRPPIIDYTSQIRTRLRELFRRHPKLERVAKAQLDDLGGLYDVLTHLARREAWLRPPFSIWIHGDLNTDNIVVDRSNNNVVFIDVHRSRYGDYLQDVATLATSSVRSFPAGKEKRGIKRANDLLISVAEDFANANRDTQFRTRLRLARARTFVTSARLEADFDKAEWLFTEGLDNLKKTVKTLKVGRKN